MREALEQVKQELGEEALILDTKSVRAGGFLGIGSSEQVEVRVAADQTTRSGKVGASSDVSSSRQAAGAARARVSEDSIEALDAHDALDTPDTLAISSSRAATYNSKENAAPRTETETTGNRMANSAKNSPTPELIFRGIEVADASPRVVHQHPAPATPSPSTFSSADIASTPQRNPITSELERLRAELREVKFYLGSLANRSATSEATEQEAPKRGTRTRKDIDPELHQSPRWEAYVEMTAAGVAPELARRAALAVLPAEMSKTNDAAGRASLANLLSSTLDFADDPLSILASTIDSPPPPIAFVGPTGVGKTTTIAKLAARIALRARRRVELITLDTHRIAAAEQLKTYAEVIGTGCHVAHSVLELDALVRRHTGDATVLIDTVGRNPHDIADQMELADYLRASTSIYKCLVLQAVTHPTDAHAAAKKFALFGANRLVITKFDETIRPGAAVSIAADAALPLLYLCAGQRVPEDLELATPPSFAARVLRAPTVVAAAA